MKIRKLKNKNGYILVIRDRHDPADNFSIFLSGPSFDQLNALKAVRESFASLIKEEFQGCLMEDFSVGDLREVEYELANLNADRIFSFALEDFFTDGGEFVNLRARAVLSFLICSKEKLLPSIRTGGVASGSDFFNRKQEIEQVWEKVEKGFNCILRAPRRFGKTSLAIYLASHPKSGWRACYVDLEGEQSPEGFILSILKSMADNPDCSECLTNGYDRNIHTLTPVDKQKLYEQERENIQEDWRAYGNKLFKSMKPEKGKLLILLDEFSFLAENILKTDSGKERLADLLEWFEDIRKNQPEGLFFLISGSEHLPSFLESKGIENDLSKLSTIRLEPFDQDSSAHEFIFLAMAKQNISVSPKEVSCILELMGKIIPYFLQLFLDILVKKCRAGQEITETQIEAAYRRELLGVESKRHFESITRQLDRYKDRGQDFSEAAKRIMTRLAVEETVEKKTLASEWAEVTRDQESFQSMFEIMRDDFYLEEQGGHVRLDSKILKDWWRAHMAAH